MKNDKKKEKIKLNINLWKKICLWIIFFVLLFVIYIVVSYEKEYETELSEKILAAQEKEIQLDKKIAEYENEIKTLKVDYVKKISAKSCVVLCFDQFGKSAYGEIIKEMDKYGFTGVIVFRDGLVPGKKGSISVELYQELLDKGWEGAIGNSQDIRVYSDFPEVCKEKWIQYIKNMQNAFEKNGLPVPSVYIPHDKESVEEIRESLGQLNMTAYTTLGWKTNSVYETSKEIGVDVPLNMGMIVGKYKYESLQEDLTTLIPEARSIAIWFRKVENGAPAYKQYTSIYMFKEQLEKLNMLTESVNVTTFTGYQEYQKLLLENNKNEYRDFQAKKAMLENQIKVVKSEITDNYAKIVKR